MITVMYLLVTMGASTFWMPVLQWDVSYEPKPKACSILEAELEYYYPVEIMCVEYIDV
jgi:hypothetical protein